MQIPTKTCEAKIGEILVSQNKCSEEHIKEALKIQRKFQSRIGTILLNLGIISELDLLEALSEQFQIPIYEPAKLKAELYLPENKVREKLIKVLKQFRIVPLITPQKELLVLLNDPLNYEGLELISKIFPNNNYKLYLSTQEEIDSYLSPSIITTSLNTYETDIEKLKDLASEAPVIKLVNRIIIRALEDKASDIHFESTKGEMIVRFRIDGVLHIVERIPSYMEKAVISRLKLLSKMNISETRLPQDGRISLNLKGKTLDIRASSIPTKFGESIVLRILESDLSNLDLKKLGFSDDHLEILLNTSKKSYGMFLTTGPTGSGKTTTLYSLMQLIDRKEKKIITIENPVEYIIDGFCQIEVNPDIGLTFASALRSILRQDPDIIMVGEIRDTETAEIAVQSSLTGHFVLSTLHTNDALGAIERLLDLGIPDYLVRSSLTGVMAQRLVRKLCPVCSRPLDKEVLFHKYPMLKNLLKTYKVSKIQPAIAEGCEHCNYTGYKGRTVIAEIIELNEEIWYHVNSFIEKNSSSLTKESLRKSLGIRSLMEDGLLKALEGKTTVEEVLRVCTT